MFSLCSVEPRLVYLYTHLPLASWTLKNFQSWTFSSLARTASITPPTSCLRQTPCLPWGSDADQLPPNALVHPPGGQLPGRLPANSVTYYKQSTIIMILIHFIWQYTYLLYPCQVKLVQCMANHHDTHVCFIYIYVMIFILGKKNLLCTAAALASWWLPPVACLAPQRMILKQIFHNTVFFWLWFQCS